MHDSCLMVLKMCMKGEKFSPLGTLDLELCNVILAYTACPKHVCRYEELKYDKLSGIQDVNKNR